MLAAACSQRCRGWRHRTSPPAPAVGLRHTPLASSMNALPWSTAGLRSPRPSAGTPPATLSHQPSIAARQAASSPPVALPGSLAEGMNRLYQSCQSGSGSPGRSSLSRELAIVGPFRGRRGRRPARAPGTAAPGDSHGLTCWHDWRRGRPPRKDRPVSRCRRVCPPHWQLPCAGYAA